MGGELLDAIDQHGHEAVDVVAGPPMLKTKYTGHGMVTDVQEPTSMLGKMGMGAAAGGGMAFLICTSKCPGHMMGNIASALPFGEVLNKITGNTKKDDDDSVAAAGESDGQQKLYHQMDSIEKILCSMNCKLAGAMGAGAGAAAGAAANKFGGGGGAAGARPGGGGGMMSKFGFGAMLDEWTAGPFASLMKQIDDMQKNVDEAEQQVKQRASTSCASMTTDEVPDEPAATSQKMKTMLEFI